MRSVSSAIAYLILILLSSCAGSKPVVLWFNAESSILSYGAHRIAKHLEPSGFSAIRNSGLKKPDWSVILISGEDKDPLFTRQKFSDCTDLLKPEGYQILVESDTLFILGRTDLGCLYGIMDLIEQLGPTCNFKKLHERRVNPEIGFRAIKFNLPWAPYRPGPATDLHSETCQDLGFWEEFLDMMVTNRFNALTLWSTHLFPYMIRAKNYPEATPFKDKELRKWQAFWKSLFRMAKERGIETYLVNWNIVVSPEFASAYQAEVYNDTSDQVKQYTRESVTQLIDEYEDLTGLGVTLADWMGNWGEDQMTPREREEWIDETFVAGMKEAGRKIKFIHRAVLAGDPAEMRKVIDDAELPEKTIVEVKFNWSHAYSTPHLSLTHSNDEGTINRGFWDPKPENYFIAWMMRNEDFFVLRWGNPNFIREHMMINHLPYVDGYFVGSEGYIPAVDYSHKDDSHKTWEYAFQKQWMFYHLWGRLLYNPHETNETLAGEIENRYPFIEGQKLLSAYTLASTVPLHLASFYKSTWDFTLYSEGFLAPWTTGYDDGISPFISIEELIRHETLDAAYMGIMEYCHASQEDLALRKNSITPPELADRLNQSCNKAKYLIADLRVKGSDPTLESELDDLDTWCYLGFYFAEKLRAAVALETFKISGDPAEKEEAVEHLQKCVVHWENVIRLTKDRYNPMPYVSMGHPEQKWPDFKSFHWENFLTDVQADLQYAESIHVP